MYKIKILVVGPSQVTPMYVLTLLKRQPTSKDLRKKLWEYPEQLRVLNIESFDALYFSSCGLLLLYF
jgi:hypothetical protein